MKQVYFLFIVALVVMSGCGGKENTSANKVEQLMFQIESVDSVTGVQRMRVSRVDESIVSNGKKYHLFIERAPSDSLPNVRSDMGLFADNRAIVRISRENGHRVFSKIFTKYSFSEFLKPTNFPHYVLEGIVFDEEKTQAGENIVLAASVTFPQTDMYVPFSITITPEGKMSILKSEDMEDLPPVEEDGGND
ncbi:DUF4738 domain-containing protein [Phocaeicola sp.]|uniref:DUF4738 domain-containing protein n=1 Tax=Phocaeicola sp. TaxID=2773926 RepID=UPI0023CB3A63|nr:DUF4738 domain-containing protein [Phocaeicola sp.]MDE5676925.1 DUF4738 domain-containing protein [Phocaeicola sp.]